MKDTHSFNRFGVVYARVGDIAKAEIAGRKVFERVGGLWALNIGKLSIIWGGNGTNT